MNKTELIKSIAKEKELDLKVVEGVINSLEKTVISELKSGHEVALPGFGTFLTKHRHARMGVNPQNPVEKINIPAVTVPKFKAGKTLKDALKGNKGVET